MDRMESENRLVQENVYACPKHFAVNSQELHGMARNAVLDERTLREIYLTGFEIAVKEGRAKAIMSSYNQFGPSVKCIMQRAVRQESYIRSLRQ